MIISSMLPWSCAIWFLFVNMLFRQLLRAVFIFAKRQNGFNVFVSNVYQNLLPICDHTKKYSQEKRAFCWRQFSVFSHFCHRYIGCVSNFCIYSWWNGKLCRAYGNNFFYVERIYSERHFDDLSCPKYCWQLVFVVTAFEHI